MAHNIQKIFAGHVSRGTLLTVLLPLSFVSFFGTLIVAAQHTPVPYNWRLDTISTLTSPRDNPDAYWIPSIGIAVATVLALPFAGYVARSLRNIAPRLARIAGAVFACGFILLFLAALDPQQDHPTAWWQHLHEYFARSSAVTFFLGMLCCCIGAFADRMRKFGGRRSFGAGLFYYWILGTLVPIGCAVVIGILDFLGGYGHQAWADQARHAFKHTIMWHLAFWEWAGSVMFFIFMGATTLLLPGQTETARADSRAQIRRQRAMGRGRADDSFSESGESTQT